MKKVELLIILAIFIVPAAVIYAEVKTETIELNKNEWVCAKTEQRKYLYPQMIGKIVVQQTGKRNECVEWRKS